VRVNTPLVVHDEFDGEVMAVRNDTGTYYSMAGSAAAVWRLVAAGAPAGAAADAVAGAYGLPVDAVRPGVETFVADLVAEGLVVDGNGHGNGNGNGNVPAPPPVTATTEPFEPPVLRAYTDMQDLLLFDPIHEVTEGWPV
jgi:hypothetical protein